MSTEVTTTSQSSPIGKLIAFAIIALIIFAGIGFLIWKKPFANLKLSQPIADNSPTYTADSIRSIFMSSNSSSTPAGQNAAIIFGANPPGGNIGTANPVAGDIGTATSTLANNDLAREKYGADYARLSSIQSGQASTTADDGLSPIDRFNARNAEDLKRANNPGAGVNSADYQRQTAGQTIRDTATANPIGQSQQVAGAFIYRNPNLGFELTLPSSWSSQVKNAGQNIIFFNAGGKQVAYIEVYDNKSNVVLDDLSQLLKNSPSVTSVSQAALSGQSALYYTGSSSGLALTYKNKILYLHDQLADPSVRNNIKLF